MRAEIFGSGNQSANAGNGLYCLGCVGAAIYFISKAITFWAGVLGLLKAMVWPAIIVYHALKALGVN